MTNETGLTPLQAKEGIDKGPGIAKIGMDGYCGSGKLTGGAPGLQIRCTGLKPR